jgi:translation initiation factor IF-2
MAKVRVYELARELSLDSKALVEKLLAGGMSIKNYMSTLDEEAVVKARDIVAGVVSEVIEEKRIKPTVIRRRKKTVKVEPVAPSEMEEVVPETAEEAIAAETVDEQASEKVEEKIDIEDEAVQVEEPLEEEPVQEIVTPEEAEPMPEMKVKGKLKKIKRKKVEAPAKIIKRAEEGPLKDLLAKPTPEKPKKTKKSVAEKPSARKPATLTPAEIAQDVAEKERKEKPAKKKKEKKKVEVQAPVKSSFRQRKKEIFERADLYEGRALRRKEKRGSKKGREVVKRQRETEITVPKAIKRRIRVEEFVTVTDLAKAMGIKATDVMKRLIQLGVMVNLNQSIDFETASVAADEFGYELELDRFEEASLIAEVKDKEADLRARPPVVTIMGHVDHGKTSLLDYIRESNIIDGESGGITQHIGAYYVQRDGGDIAFLDTPGHEAFTAMRARGAKVTDLIVLVVAADDGVMPQTKEAINHAKAAEIPILVAVNKIDKAEADPDKVRRELAELGLAPEDWGGETLYGLISAKTGEGVAELMSLILLQAEMLELKGNPNKEARGAVIEARLDRSRGPVATVLIKNGSLHQGDFFICGQHYGRVRAMLNQRGKKMESAGPSVPVEVYGISGVPMAGDEFIVVQDEKTAKEVIEHRKTLAKRQDVGKQSIVSLDDFFEKIKEGEAKELNIVLKADVQGSLEALSESLLKQSTDAVKLKMIHSATGAITESDIMLASASGAIIIGFNVRANQRVMEIAEKEKVDIRYYDVIYNVIKEIRLAMAGLLDPQFREEVIGHADIKEIFRIPKIGAVAGCYVTDGRFERNSHIRVLRDNVVVFDGKIGSLKRFKEDVKEVQSGYECGIGVENFQDVKPGDVFEAYRMEEVAAEL